MKYYPLCMNIEGQRCLVVGAGAVALRKVRSLMESGARVTVVGEDPIEPLRELENEGITIRPRKFRSGDLGKYVLVFGATDDAEVNRDLFLRCRRLGIPVNVVDDPDNSSFILPAVYRRGHLSIAVSTSGKSPAAARMIKEDLSGRYGRDYASLIDLLGAFRGTMAKRVTGHRKRASVWKKILASDILGVVRRRGRRAAGAVIEKHIREAEVGGRKK